jgi:hypothetical protein
VSTVQVAWIRLGNRDIIECFESTEKVGLAMRRSA